MGVGWRKGEGIGTEGGVGTPTHVHAHAHVYAGEHPRDAVADCRASTEGREVGIEPADKVKKLGRSAL